MAIYRERSLTNADCSELDGGARDVASCSWLLDSVVTVVDARDYTECAHTTQGRFHVSNAAMRLPGPASLDKRDILSSLEVCIMLRRCVQIVIGAPSLTMIRAATSAPRKVSLITNYDTGRRVPALAHRRSPKCKRSVASVRASIFSQDRETPAGLDDSACRASAQRLPQKGASHRAMPFFLKLYRVCIVSPKTATELPTARAGLALRSTLDLQTFVHVVEAGSLSAAARRLQTSAILVSRRIARLEKALECQLFNRTTRVFQLTGAGSGLYERARIILHEIAAAEAFLAEDHAAPKGRLRIHAPAIFTRLYLAPALVSFILTHPAIEIDLFESDAPCVVATERCDASITLDPESEKGRCVSPLLHWPQHFFASLDYVERAGAPKSLDELSSHALLAAEEVWRLSGPEGMETVFPQSLFATNTRDMLKAALLGGAGIGMLSPWEVRDELAVGLVLPILTGYRAFGDENLCVVYSSEEVVPGKLSAFLSHLAELCSDLSKTPPMIDDWETADEDMPVFGQAMQKVAS